MATEYPPLGKSFVSGYANNDRDYPIISVRKDPRVDNYKIPEDLSPHPDSKRYPNHVFVGARPTNSDERTQWDYEILPAPWVPFTRYDDDLGPIQGRRRSVKNEGQVASLAADKRVTYEAREGSAIVYTEIEESWSIAIDDDGNSLFPIKTRDFYDASRGAVQETRQLFVPTGEEVGTLENVNGVITQTSYEPYNEYLSVKIVQTYSVDGPQLIGNATNNEGQLTTVTTQRKAASGYVPPDPTATKTVEVSREDAESLIERVVDVPEVFDEALNSVEHPINIPARFLADKNITVTSSVAEGTDSSDVEATSNTISQQKQRISNFKVKTTTTTQDLSGFSQLTGYDFDETFGITIPYKEYIASARPSNTVDCEVDPLGDGRFLVKEYQDPSLSNLDSIKLSFPSRGTITGVPPVLKKLEVQWQKTSGDGSYNSSSIATFDGVTGSAGGSNGGRATGTGSVIPIWITEFEEVNTTNIPTISYFFFLKYDSSGQITESDIMNKIGSVSLWPTFKTRSYTLVATGQRIRVNMDVDVSFNKNFSSQSESTSVSGGFGEGKDIDNVIESINIRPCIHGSLSQTITEKENVKASAKSTINLGNTFTFPNPAREINLDAEGEVSFNLPATPISDVPRSGKYLIDYRVEPYRLGYARVFAEVVDAEIFA